MTRGEFATILKNPNQVTPDAIPQLKELVDMYPYFTVARMIYLRALQQSKSIYFETTLSQSALYAHDRRWLYYFIHPENQIEKKEKYVRSTKKSGTYFEMLDEIEQDGKDVNESLKVLAERLKKARIDLNTGSKNKVVNNAPCEEKPVEENVLKRAAVMDSYNADYTTQVKLLIREKKYEEALNILKALNLNNPKKSIYFADQIRFLEKIIANVKK